MFQVEQEIPLGGVYVTPRELLHQIAVGCIGKDMGGVTVPNSLSCAISVNNIARLALGRELGGGASTAEMYKALKRSSLWFYPNSRFVFITEDKALPGDIIISPTGMGGANGVNHGHVGIVGEGKTVMSNDSDTGLFKRNYTFQSWYERWRFKGHYPTFFIRIIKA